MIYVYALLSALIWLIVTLLSHGFFGTEGFFYDLPNASMPFGRFFILYTTAFAIYSMAIFKVSKPSANKRNIFIVLAGAFVFRLILIPSVPVHENDIYRYIWDGKVLASGINPYKYAPAYASIKPAEIDQQNDYKKLKSLRDEDPSFYRRISYKYVPTIYPPLAQGLFAVSALLARGSVWFMKILFVVFDIAIVFLLYNILKLLKHNPLYVVVYAWNPLVLKEFANSGHYDPLVIFFVVAAVYFILKEKYIFSSICLGLGVLSKLFPLVFIPFLLLKKQYKAFFFSLAVIMAGYLPFLIWGQTDLKNIFAALGNYAQKWSVNGFIFELLYSLLSILKNDPYILSKIICGSIFAFVWIYIIIRKRDIPEMMFLSISALFLLSPVGDPWYFCWVIPFLCIYRRFSMIFLSYLLILSYFIFTRDFGTSSIGWFKIGNLLLMQYVPFYILLIFENRAAFFPGYSPEKRREQQYYSERHK